MRIIWWIILPLAVFCVITTMIAKRGGGLSVLAFAAVTVWMFCIVISGFNVFLEATGRGFDDVIFLFTMICLAAELILAFVIIETEIHLLASIPLWAMIANLLWLGVGIVIPLAWFASVSWKKQEGS